MNIPPQLPRPQESEEVHLIDYLAVIMRRRRLFFSLFVAIFAVIALYTFLMKPVFEASATLYVKDDNGAKGGILGELALLNSSNPIDAEIEILKSRTNAEEVVKRLHLDWGISKKSSSLTVKIADFASTALEPLYTVTLTGPGSFSVQGQDDSPPLAGRVGELLRTPTLTLLLSELQGETGDSFKLQLRNFNATVSALRQSVKANEAGKKTNIIQVSYSSIDPVLARDVVNTLVQVYLDQTLAFKTEEASRTVAFVEAQLKSTRKELELSEKNLERYKSTSGVIKLDTEAEELIKKLSEVEKARAEVRLLAKQSEFSQAALATARSRGEIYTPAANADPLFSAMAGRLTELEVQMRAQSSGKTANDPQVKALQAQINEVQEKISATYTTARRNLGQELATIEGQLQQYEAKMRTLPAAERDLAGLMRLSKVNADIYTFLLQKHEEARIVKASTISNIKIVDAAITPDQPIKPQKKKNLLLGLILGLMAGVGTVFFIEYLDDTIKGSEEAQRVIGAPILAVIPFIPAENGDGANASLDPSLITHLRPKSAIAEAFRSLRTSIHFSAVHRDKKVLITTSTFPGEGKSTISANLAITLAQTGARVLLIDGDLRRPSLHDKFKQSKTPGLSEVLAGDVNVSTILHDTGIPGLSLLTAGTTPPNPAELLGSEKMAALLHSLRGEYDHILIDAPPVLAVTDAPLLTSQCDMVLLVLETERVPVKAAQRMAEMLSSVQAPVGGLVINDKTGASSERYGYFGRSYGSYGYGSGYYAEDEEKQAELLRKHKKRVGWKRFFRR